MNNTTCSSKTHYPAVWISDVHLGYKDCQAQYLLDFLNAIECDVLYLVGDIVDLWSMKRQFSWHPSHYDVRLRLFNKKRKMAHGDHSFPETYERNLSPLC